MMVTDAESTADQGEEVTTMTNSDRNLRIGSTRQGSSLVGGRFEAMCRDILTIPDLLPPDHPNGPRRARPLSLRTGRDSGVSARTIFALAGDERSDQAVVS